MRATTFWLIAGLAVPACEKDDLGQPCGTEPTSIDDPIGGEVPTIEVVRVERDGECESFQCLTHLGLAPYCTRDCELETPAVKQKSCTSDADCTGGEFAAGQSGHCIEGKCECEEDVECESPLQCAGGRCRDDDCPEGYWCKTVQEVGPLANRRYCTFNNLCSRNADCEAFGVMECRQLGCFDACLRGYLACTTKGGTCADLDCYSPCPRVAPGVRYCPGPYRDSDEAAACKSANCFESCTPLGPDCDFHRLICEPLPALNCTCPGVPPEQANDIQACPDENVVCQPDTTAQPWTAGAVEKLNVCQPEET
jgi:hypothetical protein